MDGHGIVELVSLTEARDVEFSFRDWLLMQPWTEGIESMAVDADDGITTGDPEKVDDAVFVRVSDPITGGTYVVAVEITTTSGQRKRIERSVVVSGHAVTPPSQFAPGQIFLNSSALLLGSDYLVFTS